MRAKGRVGAHIAGSLADFMVPHIPGTPYEGAILYTTGMTRPYEAYQVSHLASWVTEAKKIHLAKVNELIRNMKQILADGVWS